MTLTHRRPCKSHLHGAYQARCHHHPAERRCNQADLPYELACRKEFRLDVPGGDEAAISRALEWVMRAPLYGGRVGKNGHQGDEQSSRVYNFVGIAEEAAAAPAEDVPEDLPRASGLPGSAVQPQPNLAGCMCGEHHVGVSCKVWQEILAQSIGVASWRAGGAGRPRRWHLQQMHVAVIDVPSDGDCLFHALDAETHRLHNRTWAKDGTSGGTHLRTLICRWIAKHVDTVMDGHTIRRWITLDGETVDQYMARMRTVGGLNSWGGFFEVAVYVAITRERLPMRIAVLSRTEGGGASILAVVGSDRAHEASIIWTGTHWMIARVTSDGWGIVRQWAAAV